MLLDNGLGEDLRRGNGLRDGNDADDYSTYAGEHRATKPQSAVFRAAIFIFSMRLAGKPEQDPASSQRAGYGFLVEMQFRPAFENFGCDEAENRQNHDDKAEPR